MSPLSPLPIERAGRAAFHVGALERRVMYPGSGEIGVRQVGQAELGLLKVGSLKIGTFQVGFWQPGDFKTTEGEIGVLQSRA